MATPQLLVKPPTPSAKLVSATSDDTSVLTVGGMAPHAANKAWTYATFSAPLFSPFCPTILPFLPHYSTLSAPLFSPFSHISYYISYCHGVFSEHRRVLFQSIGVFFHKNSVKYRKCC